MRSGRRILAIGPALMSVASSTRHSEQSRSTSVVKVTSGGAPQPVTLAIPRSGVYVVEVESRDHLGRTQVVAVDLYAGGEQAVTCAGFSGCSPR